MKKETKCIIGEIIGECIIGSAIGMSVSDSILNKDNKVLKKGIIFLGSAISAATLGKVFAKGYYKACDSIFDTDFMK